MYREMFSHHFPSPSAKKPCHLKENLLHVLLRQPLPGTHPLKICLTPQDEQWVEFMIRLMLGLLWLNLMVSTLHPKSFVEYYFVKFIYKIYKDFQHTFVQFLLFNQ